LRTARRLAYENRMSTIELFGTVTSPYVRRVRIVAHELGVSVARTDTADAPGQAALRAFNPLWKVPAARLDGEGSSGLSIPMTSPLPICAR
jgi:glutathione S-transferase